MAFEYACFVSYRRLQFQSYRNLVAKFVQELRGYLEMHNPGNIELKVFIDEHDIQVGSPLDVRIAKALCNSTCMIMMYTAPYFQRSHPFCAREYKAMLELQQKRLDYLQQQNVQLPDQQRLVLPVVVSSGGELPREITALRYLEFPKYVRGYFNQKHIAAIEKIGQQIINLHYGLEAHSHQMGHDCAQFHLPPENQVLLDWIDTIKTPTLPSPLPTMEGL